MFQNQYSDFPSYLSQMYINHTTKTQHVCICFQICHLTFIKIKLFQQYQLLEEILDNQLEKDVSVLYKIMERDRIESQVSSHTGLYDYHDFTSNN